MEKQITLGQHQTIRPLLSAMSYEDLKRLKCRELPLGMSHVNDTQGKAPNPVKYFFKPLGCICAVKEGEK